MTVPTALERLIGLVRRECTDHLIAFNAGHLRRILAKYAIYYNEVHVSLGKDAPCTRPIERFGDVVAHPIPWRATSSVRSNLDFGSDRDPWCDPNGHWAVSMRIRNAARNAPPGLTSWSPRPLVSAFVGAVIGSSAT
jgi:hypothetical protein